MADTSRRIAAIDWMRGFVMVLMVIDHVSMAYNSQHNSSDSAALFVAGSSLPEFAFFTRWMSHICAPVFVFLAGTALAISIERKVAKGADSRKIDMDILKRGAFIALLDPTLVSLFSGRLTFQVLFAIGTAMMCMALLRRFSTPALLALALAWLVGGEWITGLVWPPAEDAQSIIAALFIYTYASADMVIKYPLVPWLVMMVLGWVFGRYLLDYRNGDARLGPISVLLGAGISALLGFFLLRYANDYGNLWLLREDNSWVQWLHVSKYPPSTTFTLLELGLMCVIMAGMIGLERLFGVRTRGVLLVFGQTAMFFYLAHRFFLEGTATWLGWRGFGDLGMTYLISLAVLLMLYPLCLGYRSLKQAHPNTLWARYI